MSTYIKHRMRKLAATLLAVGLCGTATAQNEPVTWTLKDVTFSGGETLQGDFW